MRRRLGGADRREASGGVGSSPAVSVKTLRRMLRLRDRKIAWHLWGAEYMGPKARERVRREVDKLDQERKGIRNRIKYRRFLCCD